MNVFKSVPKIYKRIISWDVPIVPPSSFTLIFEISTQSVLTGIIFNRFEKDGGSYGCELKRYWGCIPLRKRRTALSILCPFGERFWKDILTSEPDDSDELPEDAYDSDKYVIIPHKNELELGKNLVFEFISEHLPDEVERIHAIFRKKGAYARFKELLDAKGFLEEWYTFEDVRQKEALREWCSKNGIEITD